MSTRVGVIGSGVAGLACARHLAAAGLSPVVLDKGRAVGGRLATRVSRNGWQFDHGAQFVTAHGTAFGDCLASLEAHGEAARWADESSAARWVGTPDMGAIARSLGQGLEIRQQREVSSIQPHGSQWRVVSNEAAEYFDRVVVTVPAPQLGRLLGEDHPLAAALARVHLAPCLTLMAAIDARAPCPFIARADASAALGWIAQDSSKPGRSAENGTAWVAHATPEWSAEHLELAPQEMVEHLLPELLDRIAARPDQILYAAGHRWRFAKVTAALGEPFLRSPCGTLYAGGDWCIGPRVEAAWSSGRAIAADILGR